MRSYMKAISKLQIASDFVVKGPGSGVSRQPQRKKLHMMCSAKKVTLPLWSLFESTITQTLAADNKDLRVLLLFHVMLIPV